MITHTSYRLLCVVAALLPLMHGIAPAHGGEDHGSAAVATGASAAGPQMSTFGASGRYELLMKYTPGEAGAPTKLRLYLADYASNRPVEGAAFVLSSKPAGVKFAAPAVMASPGIYDVTAVFPADTLYTLTATLASGESADVIPLTNVYAGEAAERFLAGHGMASEPAPGGFMSGILPWAASALVLLIALALLALRLRRRRAARPAGAEPETTASATTETINEEDHR